MNNEIDQDDSSAFEDEAIIEKPSRAERFKRSIAARLRRKDAKLAKDISSFKEEKEARERLNAKRVLAKQKRQRSKKIS